MSSPPPPSHSDRCRQDSYVPDDLMSLLDAGIHADHPSVIIDADTMFSEDMFGSYSTSVRRSGSSRAAPRGDRDERDTVFPYRDRRAGGAVPPNPSRRWMIENALRDTLLEKDTDGEGRLGLGSASFLNRRPSFFTFICKSSFDINNL